MTDPVLKSIFNLRYAGRGLTMPMLEHTVSLIAKKLNLSEQDLKMRLKRVEEFAKNKKEINHHGEP